MIRAPIVTSLSTKKRRFSNIFSKIRIVPSAWVASASAIEVRSAGKAGQGPSSIFGIASPWSSRTVSFCSGDHQVPVLDHRLQAEPAEVAADALEVVGHHVADAQLAAGGRGQRHKLAISM